VDEDATPFIQPTSIQGATVMFKKIIAAALACFAAAAFASVDINKANQAELEAVKGVGTVSAGKMLAERKKGAFKDWADVMQRVGGIKEAKANKLSAAGLTVNGEAYKPGSAAPSQDKGPKSKKASAQGTSTEAKSSQPKLAKQQ
jgi:competence protein ComEA